MSAHEAAFDPYLKWLGIRTKEQPPDHYRLLGVELFESDPDVIATATDARMLHVKTFQTGRHAALSQRILNEIAAAKVCLLNPEKKAEYDRALREKLAAETVASQPPPPPPRMAPPALPVRDPSQTSESPPAPRSADTPRIAGLSPFVWKFAALAAVAGLLLLAIILLLSRGTGEEKPVAQGTSGDTAAAPPAEVPTRPKETVPAPKDPDEKRRELPKEKPQEEVHPKPVEPPAKPDRPVSKPEIPPAKEAAKEAPKPDDAKAAPSEVAPSPKDDVGVMPAAKEPEKVKPEAKPTAPTEDEPVPAKKRPSGAQPGDEDVKVRPAGKGRLQVPAEEKPVPSKRLPPPSSDQRREIEKEIRSRSVSDFTRAKNAEQKLILAGRLFSQGMKNEQEPATRYAQVWMACELATAAGELGQTLEVIDELAKLYDIDPAAAKFELLGKTIETARVLPGLPATALEWTEALVSVTDEALAAGKTETAKEGVRLLNMVSKKAKLPELGAVAMARGKLIEAINQQREVFDKAVETLRSDPENIEASYTAGRWYCLVEGRWKEGLPLLVKCGNPGLRALAQQELADPADAAAQFTLGAAWAKQAEDETALKPQMAARAIFWLQRAKEQMALDDSPRMDRQMAQLIPFLPRRLTGQGAVRPGVNVALAANGGRATSSALNDGIIPMTVNQQGVASSSSRDNDWTVTLDRVYRIREVRVKLLDNTAECFSLLTSPDGTTFVPLVGRQQGIGWQSFRFLPRPVRAIKLVGHFAAAGATFYVSELEAYTAVPLPTP